MEKIFEEYGLSFVFVLLGIGVIGALITLFKIYG